MKATKSMNNKMRWTRNLPALTGTALAMMSLSGCHVDMWRQPKARAQQESPFFADGSSSRLPVAGTVAHGSFNDNDAFTTGFTGGTASKLVKTIPIPVTKETLKRGQDRYQIFCTPCHGKLGDGNGMIAMRGFSLRRPPGNYHEKRLREMPVGHFYDVITNGFGAMFSYASRIKDPNDRWAIVAYIRVLQKSQNAALADVPAEERAKLEAAGEAKTKTGGEH